MRGLIAVAQGSRESVGQLVAAGRNRRGRDLRVFAAEDGQPVIDAAFQDIGVGHALGHQRLPGFGGGGLIVAHHHVNGVGRWLQQQGRDGILQLGQREMARLVDVEQVVFSLAAHIQQHQVQAVVGHAVQQLAGMDLHLTRVQHGLLDSLLARPLLSRGRLADEDHGQCSHHQQRRAGIAGLRLFGQVALAKDVL